MHSKKPPSYIPQLCEFLQNRGFTLWFAAKERRRLLLFCQKLTGEELPVFGICDVKQRRYLDVGYLGFPSAPGSGIVLWCGDYTLPKKRFSTRNLEQFAIWLASQNEKPDEKTILSPFPSETIRLFAAEHGYGNVRRI